MAGQTDWNKDIPWLGAWIPISAALACIWGVLAWIGVPTVAQKILFPLMALAVYVYLWGPKGRFARTTTESEPDRRSRARSAGEAEEHQDGAG